MPRRHPLPKIWLMTDPRLGDDLLDAIRRLPFGSGVVFRHYELPEARRRALFMAVAKVCRQRAHLLLLAADERTAIRWGADGFHQRSSGRTTMIHSATVHDRAELNSAKRQRADLIFVSPLFATASHPRQRPLGMLAFGRLAEKAKAMKVIALGGVNRRNAQMLNPRLVHGWAGIDAFRKTPD
jgi:thiamine-phosphate pyrophosphorylase